MQKKVKLLPVDSEQAKRILERKMTQIRRRFTRSHRELTVFLTEMTTRTPMTSCAAAATMVLSQIGARPLSLDTGMAIFWPCRSLGESQKLTGMSRTLPSNSRLVGR